MTPPADAGAGKITRSQLYDRIQRRDPVYIFEVLPKMYWRKHHLPGARSLPLDQLSTISTLVPDKRAEIVVYCWNFT